MKFKLDENLPIEAAALIQAGGHEVATVFQEGLAGEDDALLAERIRTERRVLLTLDSDFGDIRLYPPGRYSGIIVLRLKNQDKPSVLALVERVRRLLSPQQLERCLWIVEPGRIRIREGPAE